MENKKISQLDPYSGSPDSFDIPGVADGQTRKTNLGAAILLKIISEQLLRPSNLKTINGVSIVGVGNIVIDGGGSITGVEINTLDSEDEPTAEIQDGVLVLGIPAARDGVSDYTQLTNKPSINGNTLVGDIKMKTVNGVPIVGEGNIVIDGGGSITGVEINTLDSEDEPTAEIQNGVLVLGIPAARDGVSDYTQLTNKPSINGNTLVGDTMLKTVNGVPIVGEGNIVIDGGGSTGPEYVTVTDTDFIIASLVGNKVYNCTNPLTSLTITAYGDTKQETVLFFETGPGFVFSAPSETRYIIEKPVFSTGMKYIMSIQNNTLVIGEIVDQ